MKRDATQEHDTILSIPSVVGIVPVRVEPALAIVVVHIEHVRVAVRILYSVPSISPPLEAFAI